MKQMLNSKDYLTLKRCFTIRTVYQLQLRLSYFSLKVYLLKHVIIYKLNMNR